MEEVKERGATLRTALALTCVILLVEFAGGLISHSLALLSDARHVPTDIFALGLAWVGVVIAGAVILLTAWLYIDPILSLGIAALIALGAWRIVRETVNLLLEGTPSDVDLAAVSDEIKQTDQVVSLHDLHVWALSSEDTALSVHVVVGDCPLGEAEHLVRDLEQRLCARFDIGHTTIQVESCHPCGEIHHGAGG